jgi:hypothetical protein
MKQSSARKWAKNLKKHQALKEASLNNCNWRRWALYFWYIRSNLDILSTHKLKKKRGMSL